MRIAPARRMRGVERSLIRRIYDAAPTNAIDLGLGQPDLPTPAPVGLAAIRSIVEGRTAYTATSGDGELREAIAAEYGALASGAEVTMRLDHSVEMDFIQVSRFWKTRL